MTKYKKLLKIYNLSKNLIMNLFIFIIAFIFFLNFFGLVYFVLSKYENTYYKFEKMSVVNNIYKNINIKLGNCSFIKEYYEYKIDSSPIDHSNKSLDELINMTKNCNEYKSDYLFLNSLNHNKLNLPLDESKSIYIISKYWYFISDKQKIDIEKYFKKFNNKELIELFKKNFK